MSEPTPWSLDDVVGQSAKQASCDLHGEAAILDIEQGVYYSLEAVGARIWQLLAEPRPLREVRDVIVAEYEVEPQRCTEDLLRLMGELDKAGLIERGRA